MSNSFYSAPSSMSGGYVVYGGYRRQRGAGALGSILGPVGQIAMTGMKKLVTSAPAKRLAKKVAKKGAKVLAGVAWDAIRGYDVGQSLKDRSKAALSEAMGFDPFTKAPPPKNNKRKASQVIAHNAKIRKVNPKASQVISRKAKIRRVIPKRKGLKQRKRLLAKKPIRRVRVSAVKRRRLF